MLTLKKVNAEINKLGLGIELVKGEGYFYFFETNEAYEKGVKIDHSLGDVSVFVFSLNQLPLEDWLECAKKVKFLDRSQGVS